MPENIFIVEAQPNTTLGTIIVVSGAFLLLLLLIKKFAWQSIADILKKREEKIAADLDSAEQSRLIATQLEEKRQKKLNDSQGEAVELIKHAKESSEQTRRRILAEANEEIARLKEKSRQAIAQEHDEALASIKEEATVLSVQIAEKILSKELTPEVHAHIIDSFTESLGTSNESR